jgi:hypothetical protein
MSKNKEAGKGDKRRKGENLKKINSNYDKIDWNDYKTNIKVVVKRK